MSKATKSVVAAEAVSADMPFEEALQKLEAVVDAMESDDLPLETMLGRFQEGMRLSELCQSKLAAAELKIQQLERTAGGEFALQPLEPAPPTAGE